MEPGSKELDGNVAAELAIVGDEDTPHSPAADLLADAIAVAETRVFASRV